MKDSSSMLFLIFFIFLRSVRYRKSPSPLISPIIFYSGDKFDYLTSDMAPTPGPALDTAYVPGTPGAAWTEEEIESTRFRILQAIHPDWNVQKDMYG